MDDFHHNHQREIEESHQNLQEMERLHREQEHFDRLRKNMSKRKYRQKEESSSFITFTGIAFFALVLFASLGGTGVELAFPLIALIIFILAPLFKSEGEDYVFLIRPEILDLFPDIESLGKVSTHENHFT